MTHAGLVHEIERYDKCQAGWAFSATESLLKLMTIGKGLPN
jgi:hypothetical protein